MNSLNEVVNKIRENKQPDKTFLIGIDGFGGSGKSTVARFLKENLVDVCIVEMDDFYLPELKRADYHRVDKQVLTPLAGNAPAKYQRYDWKSDSLAEWHTIDQGGIVIVEGVYSLNNEIASKYNLKIWVDCPPEIGMTRGVARDLARDNVDTKDKWINEWMPLEKEYFDTQNPKQIVDYVIDGTKKFK